MSIQFYKVLHLASMVLLLSGSAILLVGQKRDKLLSALTGIASLLVLVSGFGLAHKAGYALQFWIWAKLGIWFLIAGFGHMIAKRFPQKGVAAYWISMVLAALAAYLAVYKP